MGHVQRAGDAHAFERFLFRVFLAHGHEAGHFVLGDSDFLAAPVGKREIADNEFFARRSLRGVLSEGHADFSENAVRFAVALEKRPACRR